MLELKILVEISALQISEKEGKKEVSKLYRNSVTIAVFMAFFGIVESIFCYYIGEAWSNWIAIILPSILLLSIGLKLSISYTALRKCVDNHFDEILREEKKAIKKIFFVFTISYFSRAVVYLVVNGIYVIDSFSHVEDFVVATIMDVMYPFWDFMPLMIIMKYHYHNFSAQAKIQAERDAQEEEERQ